MQEIVDVFVAKNGMIGDVINVLQKKLQLSSDVVKLIRIYDVHNGKFYKELPPEHSVASVTEFVQLFAEVTPEDELNADAEHDWFIYAFHFQNEPTKVHGVPFKFVVKNVRDANYLTAIQS